MTSRVAIDVRNLSKSYPLYNGPSDVIRDALGIGGQRPTFLALNDVSFQVEKGEVVGVIGRNGSGKSTLLKLLAGTLNSSAGSYSVNGKISAILELGTGFNPNFTGRENVIMGGMTIGMSKGEILKKLDSIIDFSGLAEVIDRPFKTYSSGMQARLTFSTAVSVDPDIFIVDEALAAGDALFVGKCMRRIEEICRSGATVLFVSHSMNLIERFCTKAVHLEGGKIVNFGDAKAVCKQYELTLLQEQRAIVQKKLEDSRAKSYSDILRKEGDRIGTGEVIVKHLKIFNDKGVETSDLTVGQAYDFEINIESSKDDLPVIVTLLAQSGAGQTAFSTTSEYYIDRNGVERSTKIIVNKGLHVVRFRLDPLLLGRGEYYITLGLSPNYRTNDYTEYYDYLYMRWFFTVNRSSIMQWVSYEQPVDISVSALSLGSGRGIDVIV